MPQFLQGDVFEAINTSRAEFAVVFGHIGFNEMSQRWADFSTCHPQLARVRDPFADLTNGPIALPDGRWLWFISEEKNHGMTNEHLVNALDAALSWASRQHIQSVATNGVANTDHGRDTMHNRQSDEQRARFLIAYATAAEQKYGVSIELISLNDVFVRVC
jgi:hypothetical protein